MTYLYEEKELCLYEKPTITPACALLRPQVLKTAHAMPHVRTSPFRVLPQKRHSTLACLRDERVQGTITETNV
jgi:hypothetical protein